MIPTQKTHQEKNKKNRIVLREETHTDGRDGRAGRPEDEECKDQL